MLSLLKIQNLVLIRNAEIAFGPGLNILTGETGSGKSAVLSAIRLICGERAESQLIAKEANLAIVEAVLNSWNCDWIERAARRNLGPSGPSQASYQSVCGKELDAPFRSGESPSVQEGVLQFFQKEGIALPAEGHPLHIRREIHASGKSRCFIEDQQVSLAFLRKCVGASIVRVDQSSSHSLCSLDEQRRMLDAYANLTADTASFSRIYAELKEKEVHLQTLLVNQGQKDRELEWALKDLHLIEEVNWLPGEEEKLSQEHHLLTHSQELIEKISTVSASLTESPQPILAVLKQCQYLLENCSRSDPQLAPLAQTIKTTVLELDETARALQAYANRLDADPQRLHSVEQRIAAIEAIKRRYGVNQEELQNLKEKLHLKIDSLNNLDEEIGELQKEISQSKQKIAVMAETLSSKRKEAAHSLSLLILNQLKSLNLPHAQFQISLKSKPICSAGIDEIRFLFSANPGLPPTPLEQCASGGELSRLLLAIKIVLSDKEENSCLIFDEIDSNVGGQTAAILGEKLKNLAQTKQVICVTHFVQVARCAMHHFLVSKAEEKGSSLTSVFSLDSKGRDSEYNRMLGRSN